MQAETGTGEGRGVPGESHRHGLGRKQSIPLMQTDASAQTSSRKRFLDEGEKLAVAELLGLDALATPQIDGKRRFERDTKLKKIDCAGDSPRRNRIGRSDRGNSRPIDRRKAGRK